MKVGARRARQPLRRIYATYWRDAIKAAYAAELHYIHIHYYALRHITLLPHTPALVITPPRYAAANASHAAFIIVTRDIPLLMLFVIIYTLLPLPVTRVERITPLTLLTLLLSPYALLATL